MTPRFDQRQRWYAGLLGTGAYTPQAVVAGEIDLVGSDPRLEDALDFARTNRMPARIEFVDASRRPCCPELDWRARCS